MKSHVKLLAGVMALGSASMLAATLSSSPASARIQCKGPYQIIKGIGSHASPYCEDNYLAHVARAFYGIRVSNRQIRFNPNRKAEVCQAIGHDTRIRDICRGDLPGDNGGRRIN